MHQKCVFIKVLHINSSIAVVFLQKGPRCLNIYPCCRKYNY